MRCRLSHIVCVLALTHSVSAAEPRIEMSSTAATAAFVVKDLPRGVAASLRGKRLTASTFAVYVGKGADAAQAPMLGSLSLTGRSLRFQPRFPLQPGVSYTAVFKPAEGKPITKTFLLRKTKSEQVSVTGVSPSAERIPENLLRMYVHFSAPMSQRDSYRHIRLLDEQGKEVELPFLELPQELWNDAGTRLTLLLDPGRVKKGLKPREDSGPVLVAGKKYTLQIDRSWSDAAGQPLAKAFRKSFTATKADETQPAPSAWNIKPPQSGTRQALTVTFPQPLDRGMVERVISVRNGQNRTLVGKVAVSRHETQWEFTPKEKWSAGRHSLSIQSSLEDPSGNSIRRPFEVDQASPPEEQAKSVSVIFDVR